jgi:predicted RNA-binding protein YlxR (DUF448 family)/ribosomal protein L30E
MAKEEPKRSCLGCRMVKNRGELLRFVLSPDGIPAPDLLSKLPGRGAYTCTDKSCLREAVSRRQFDRAFKREVKLPSADELISMIVSTMEDRIASYVALANKAGKIVSGSDMVMHILKKGGKERIILFSTDVSCDIRQKVINLAEKNGVEYFSLFDKERVGALIGKSLRSVVAVEGQGFVSSIKKELERYRNFVGGGA